ncbi:MAG: hypothetical protein KDC82_09040, partial [Bacteroidetes bacterium]|nr:hypothetical protein [Bacteroidota bacterium]
LFYSLVPDSLQSKPLALQADQLLKESIPSNAQINSSFYKTSSPLTGLPYFRKGIKITNANGQTLEFGVAAYYHPDYRLFAFVMVSVTDSYRYSNTDFLALNSFTWLPKAMLYPENNLKITLPVNLLEKSTFLSEEIDFLNLEALISQASNELNTPSIFISTSSEVCSLDKARDKLSKNKSRIGLDFNRVYQSYETNSYLLRSDEDKYVYRLVVLTSSKNGDSPCIKSLFTMKMEFQYEVPKNIDAGAIYIFFNLGGKDTERLYTYYYTWMQYMAATIEM